MNDGRGFDLILRGGRVISPASGIDGVKDVGVRNGTIAAIQDRILENSALPAAVAA
jgi:dihydroorotase